MPRFLAVLCAFVSATYAGIEAGQHFSEKVRPLLESRCITCHGPDKVKGNLRMDSRAALLKGGDSGPALVPGKPSESLLLQAVLHTKKDLEMPPKEKLTATEIAILERWIIDGAPWPEAKSLPATAATSTGERIGDAWSDARNPIVRIFGGQRLDLWSLKPVTRPQPPNIRNSTRVKNSIDRFILARVEAAGLKPAPEAERRTLARRVYFDLSGLPPTPEEMNSFLNDTSPGAYERLVDRLLDSPRYGEHWARQWLDVVRYSDSNGFDWDEFRKTAWRFRDYTIRSFNEDKPFNDFIIEQLAGDELLEGEPRNLKEQDLLIASGFLRLGPQDNSAPLFNEQARARAELMADLVETTSSAFLGLTMSCNRCHDHKTDPLSHADHFRMRAFFEGVKTGDDLPIDLAEEQEKIRVHNAAVDSRLKPLDDERSAMTKAVRRSIRKARLEKLPAEEQALLQLAQEKQSDEQKKLVEALEKKIGPDEKEVVAA